MLIDSDYFPSDITVKELVDMRKAELENEEVELSQEEESFADLFGIKRLVYNIEFSTDTLKMEEYYAVDGNRVYIFRIGFFTTLTNIDIPDLTSSYLKNFVILKSLKISTPNTETNLDEDLIIETEEDKETDCYSDSSGCGSIANQNNWMNRLNNPLK